MRRWLILLALAACGRDFAAIDAPRAIDAPTIDADLGPDELPCDVRDALEAACTTCHASPPNSSAPVALTSRYAFFQHWPTPDAPSVGEVAAQRLHDAQAPMPPASEPPASAAQLATLDAWLATGMPAGSCGAIPARPAPTTCASGTFWTGGETGSELMEPGRPCRACHQLEATYAAYYFAGTAYDALHEQDLCNSPPPNGARIEILDMAGHVTLTLTANAAGNFMSTTTAPAVPIPYTARLVANGRTRAMTTPQTSGDCNDCHTEQGDHVPPATVDPPGRLVWPAPVP